MRWIPVCFLCLFCSKSIALNVIIDPGHGGVDAGTVRRDLRESETALKVSKLLAAKLRRHRDVHVTLTRTEDRQVSLLDRVRFAEQAHGDLLISIHLNSSPDAKAKGAEFYFENQLAGDEEAMALAHRENTAEQAGNEASEQSSFPNAAPSVRAILEDLLDSDRIAQSSRLCKFLKTHWLGNKKRKASSIHQAPFVVISEVHMPAVLIELGFVTNRDDYQALTDSEYLDQAAQSLYEGLLAYKDSLDKALSPALDSPTISSR